MNWHPTSRHSVASTAVVYALRLEMEVGDDFQKLQRALKYA